MNASEAMHSTVKTCGPDESLLAAAKRERPAV
jgi:hypothetical protein